MAKEINKQTAGVQGQYIHPFWFLKHWSYYIYTMMAQIKPQASMIT